MLATSVKVLVNRPLVRPGIPGILDKPDVMNEHEKVVREADILGQSYKTRSHNLQSGTLYLHARTKINMYRKEAAAMMADLKF